MSRKKKMNIEEFVEFGYLQEANRRYFHPLGLALEVKREDKDVDIGIIEDMVLNGIWDKRDLPEGLLLSKVDLEKAERVTGEIMARRPARVALSKCHNSGIQKVRG